MSYDDHPFIKDLYQPLAYLMAVKYSNIRWEKGGNKRTNYFCSLVWNFHLAGGLERFTSTGRDSLDRIATDPWPGRSSLAPNRGHVAELPSRSWQLPALSRQP